MVLFAKAVKSLFDQFDNENQKSKGISTPAADKAPIGVTNPQRVVLKLRELHGAVKSLKSEVEAV